MTNKLFKKIAILSHILPPSPSGQAIMLYRLLKGLPADRYCLLSRENYENIEHNSIATEKLSAKYYYLEPVLELPILNRLKSRLPSFLRYSKLFSFLKYLKASHLGFTANVLQGTCRRAQQIEKILQKEQCELLIACTGDPYDLPAGYLASKRTNTPFIPYIFDDYVYQWTGICRLIAKYMEPIILKYAADVIVPNEHLQKEYSQRHGIKSTVIRNPCFLPNLEELDRADKAFNNNEINIVYTGSIYRAHYDAFHNLITAIQQLRRSDVKLHLYTNQPEAELIQNGILGPMVVYHSHVSHFEVLIVSRHADMLFLPLAFNSPIPEVIRTSAPGKAGEYLSVGKPVLVHAPHDSFVSWYFREHNCGVVVDRNDPNVLSDAICKIISDLSFQTELGISARNRAEMDFEVAQIRAKFVELLENTTGLN